MSYFIAIHGIYVYRNHHLMIIPVGFHLTAMSDNKPLFSRTAATPPHTALEKASPPLYPYNGIVPTIHPRTFIAQTAVIIGDTHIGEGSGIWYGCVIRGDVNEIRIGKRTNIQDLTMIHCAELGQGTYIGDNITVGHSAVLHACTIEDDAMIGIQACVMDDCIVEQGAIVAAGALVTPGKTVKSGEVWAGNPAKKLRDINDKDLAFLEVNRQRYERLAYQYQTEQYSS